MSHFWQLGLIAVIVATVLGCLWANKQGGNSKYSFIGTGMAFAFVAVLSLVGVLSVLAIQGFLGW